MSKFTANERTGLILIAVLIVVVLLALALRRPSEQPPQPDITELAVPTQPDTVTAKKQEKKATLKKPKAPMPPARNPLDEHF